ncbi:MAG: prenyltransferase/squalene oxidase repeat-containing protein, partial [Candidatus Heimdallarchaeota archaeon]
MRHFNSGVVILCLLVLCIYVQNHQFHQRLETLSLPTLSQDPWSNSNGQNPSTIDLRTKSSPSSRRVLNGLESGVASDKSDSVLSSPKDSLLVNLTALRGFLSRVKLTDGGFMWQPIEQGFIRSDTWATFLAAWICEMVGFHEISFLYLGNSPVDYFLQLDTNTNGFRNSTLSATVTVFATTLALLTFKLFSVEIESTRQNTTCTYLYQAQDKLTGGFKEEGCEPDLFTTALVLQTLTLLDQPLKNHYLTSAFLKSYYNVAGGFFDDPNLERSLVWETFLGVWASLFISPNTPFPTVVEYLFATQQPDGSWGSLPDTFAAVATLELLGKLAMINQPDVMTFVAGCQLTEGGESVLEGGFKAAPTAANDTVSTVNTAYALYLLYVLGEVPSKTTLIISTDQDVYIQGETATVQVEAYYGDEFLEMLNMTFDLPTVQSYLCWSLYD